MYTQFKMTSDMYLSDYKGDLHNLQWLGEENCI